MFAVITLGILLVMVGVINGDSAVPVAPTTTPHAYMLPYVESGGAVSIQGLATATPFHTPTATRIPVPTITVVPKPIDPEEPYYRDNEFGEVAIVVYNNASGVLVLQQASFRDVYIGGWQITSTLNDWYCTLTPVYLTALQEYDVSLYDYTINSDAHCGMSRDEVIRTVPDSLVLLDSRGVVIDWIDRR